jgi:two-component system, NtrC family, sensor kinase
MKKIIYKITLLSLILGYSFSANAQVPGVDSLQNKILQSVQKMLKEKGVSKYYNDTNYLPNGKSPGDLTLIFKEMNKNISMAKSMGDIGKVRGGYFKLSTIDSMRGNYKGAYENYKLYTLYRDSLQKKETEQKELQAKMQFEFDKKQAIAKAEEEKRDAEQKRIKTQQYFAIVGLAVLLVVIVLIALIQWKSNNQKKKANILLQEQKGQVESALSELKSTQAQLIHSEKMASLGELTGGIAHEIQNPLNFVNNFSDVNRELIGEMKTAIEKGNMEEVKILAGDIETNEEKINHHGKRADTIVKGMLQHSRSNTGQKESTDINDLADEYMRLSYHGLNAKDSSFQATTKTDFDESIGNLNIIPQDIGRVLLNLYNNAFYAVNEKRKQNVTGYEPAVSVSTKRVSDKVIVSVKDNGNGIPEKIVDKIFQPFFTTKPTGQGTGLGLSLSYDIVKANGGEIKVNTKKDEGSEFVIQLPTS